MNVRRYLAISLFLALGATAGAAKASAQSGPFVEATAELSPVHIGGYERTWRVGRLAGGVEKNGRFGLNAGVERHQRGALVDWAVQTSGFHRLGEWTLAGGAAYASTPDFLYHRSLEGELTRRVVGGLVLRGGYRYLEFPSTTVHIGVPGVSWYFSRGEIGAQTFLVRNDLSGQRSSILLARSAIDVSRRVTLTGGVAAGARIFDVDTFGRGSHDAWQAFGSMRLRAADHWTMEVLAGGAHEDPLFTQQTIAMRVRWGF